jgi:chromate reductase
MTVKMETPREIKVDVICGSLRSGSFNRKLLREAVNIAAGMGTKVTEINLGELGLPVFNADLREKDFPSPVEKLKEMIASADVLLIATPEYNHSIPGPLKNAIDWASDITNPFSGKAAAIFGASTGLFGTLRAQIHLRQVLASLNVELLPQPQVFVRSAEDAFLPDGTLKDRQVFRQLERLIEETVNMARRKLTVNTGRNGRI